MSEPWVRRVETYDGACASLVGFPPSRVTVYAISGVRGVVYVGSTSQQIEYRIRGHFFDAKRNSDLPIHAWMRASNFKFDVLFLEETDNVNRASVERRWVEHYKETLLNVTDGGPGLSGHKFAGTGHAQKIAAKLRFGANCTCETCGAQFWRKPRDIKKGNSRFCSRECYQAWQRGRPKAKREVAA